MKSDRLLCKRLVFRERSCLITGLPPPLWKLTCRFTCNRADFGIDHRCHRQNVALLIPSFVMTSPLR
ncbi:hypothetical protein SynA1560_02978 [Synechococcus sp. A15-60]|nr:hypothetical protein SynA1560_02978 [Synechococcus sp. A15-60]